MRLPHRISVTFAALAAFATTRSAFAQPVAPAAPSVTVAHVAGTEALDINGSASPAQSIGITLFARFSEDVPDVVLARRTVVSDAAGHYTTKMSHAPAYMRGALVFVEVRVLPDGGAARTVLPIGPPNVPAPPDAIPPSAR